MENIEKREAEDTRAYLEVDVPQVTDERRLALYEIYRNESGGDTYEPLESMRQKHLGENQETDQAA